ncbi:heterokaryon incompatibility protein-domain-containing protein [Nemania abortiva]|nr:heterokaryon incompatibility protein-domain-containing protein [Nemania abortiva]
MSAPPQTLEELAYRSALQTSSGNGHVAVLARAWIDNCLENHKNCSKPSTKWKPTRLLDISEGKIKLVLGESASDKEVYATLSHCWGTDKFPVLTPSNMHKYLDGVDITEFPLTFQEVIITTRRLRLRYLWIDCYCILQETKNDPRKHEARKDWEREGSCMGKVYANSLLNIGAAESKGPTQGLFRDRRPLDIRKFREVSGIEEMQLNSSLFKRAWVIQECVMAPRMLSFARGHVYWQCSQLCACEGDPDEVKISFREHASIWHRSHPFWILDSLAPDRRPDPKDIEHRWASFLDAYCTSRLTYFKKDHFKALDAVAKKFERLSGEMVKYGVMASTLPKALLFNTIPERPEAPPSNHMFFRDARKPGALPPYSMVIPSKHIPEKARRDGPGPTWHWSSCYPYVSHNPVHTSYLAVGNHQRPLAYSFMSKDCKPLPEADSDSLWPRICLIGRLLLVRSPSHDGYDTKKDKDHALSNKTVFYLPLIQYGTNRFEGLIVMRSYSVHSAFAVVCRRVGTWDSSEADFLKNFGVRPLHTRPRLIVLE